MDQCDESVTEAGGPATVDSLFDSLFGPSFDPVPDSGF